MTPADCVVLGTRGSRLALIQAEYCAGKLRASGLEVEVRPIKTTSEQRPHAPLSVIDQRDVFTRQLDKALLAGQIDLAVHSLKDVPTEPPEGIALSAFTVRHDPSDVVLSREGWRVEELPEGAVVATSSLRRRSQLLNLRPDLRIVEIRGNVDTRVRKMSEGEAHALVLARAGIERLELDVPYAVIPPEVVLPAVGQGALVAAVRKGDPLRGDVRDALNHVPTERAVCAERAMLRSLQGGCRVPVGALAVAEDGTVRLRGVVASVDGRSLYSGEAVGERSKEVGERLAEDLLERGAATVLEEVRETRV